MLLGDINHWMLHHVFQMCNGSYEEPYTNPCAPVHIVTGSGVSKYTIGIIIMQKWYMEVLYAITGYHNSTKMEIIARIAVLLIKWWSQRQWCLPYLRNWDTTINEWYWCPCIALRAARKIMMVSNVTMVHGLPSVLTTMATHGSPSTTGPTCSLITSALPRYSLYEDTVALIVELNRDGTPGKVCACLECFNFLSG